MESLKKNAKSIFIMGILFLTEISAIIRANVLYNDDLGRNLEGYMGNIAAGLLAGINAARMINGQDLLVLPEEMVSGALFHYIATAEAKHFQPMKANFGILPPISEKIRSKRERYMKYSERALEKAESFFRETL